MSPILSQVQVNIPFPLLADRYLSRFVGDGMNPEIGLDAAALDRYKRSDFMRVADGLRDAGAVVTLHAPFMDLAVGSPDPLIRSVVRRRFEQALELVPLFRPKTMVCHTGYDERRYGHIRHAWLATSLETWTWLADRLEETNAVLMIENVYEAGPEDLKPLFLILEGRNAGFCLDTGHQAAFGRAPLDAWLDVMEPYLGQVHLHDNRGREDEHLPMGSGTVDFEALFSRLARKDRPPPVCTLEPHREADLAPALAYLERVWPW